MIPASAHQSSIVALIVASIWGFSSPAFAQGQESQASKQPPSVDPALATRLKTEVPKLLARHNVPGLSMILIRSGEIVWSRAFGRRRSDRDVPVTERTVFEAASMSKPLFAYAALKLVEQGKLDLDRSLDSYLPEPYLPDQPDTAKITARMVLTHTTGLPNWRRGKPLALRSKPGAKYVYSGEGFVYLQRVVERLAGKDLDRWMKERLLAPLGMDRSSFVWHKTLSDDFAGGHDQAGKFKDGRRMYSKANAAYTLYTTPTDYGRFLLEIIRPDHEQRHTLKPAMRREMLTDQPVPGSYGLGWVLSGSVVSHSGSNGTGFRCYSRFHKTSGDGLVIMTNGVNGAVVWKAVVKIIDGAALESRAQTR